MPGRQLPIPELHEAAKLASDLAERTKGQGLAGPVVKAPSGQWWGQQRATSLLHPPTPNPRPPNRWGMAREPRATVRERPPSRAEGAGEGGA